MSISVAYMKKRQMMIFEVSCMILACLTLYLLNELLKKLNESAAFRVTINDYSIKHNVYNPKVYTNGIKVKPYRLYKQGTQIQDISKPILHNHRNHMTGSTVNNTGKDNQRPNPSQFQKSRSRQSLRKGNNN